MANSCALHYVIKSSCQCSRWLYQVWVTFPEILITKTRDVKMGTPLPGTAFRRRKVFLTDVYIHHIIRFNPVTEIIMLVLHQLGPIPDTGIEIYFLQVHNWEKGRDIEEERNWCGGNWGDRLMGVRWQTVFGRRFLQHSWLFFYPYKFQFGHFLCHSYYYWVFSINYTRTWGY